MIPKGQVPHYLIIGDGRLASHLACYFKLLDLPFTQWSRKKNSSPPNQLIPPIRTIVLLAISDAAILPFLDKYPQLYAHQLIHFSGALFLEKIPSFHPLMTFSTHLYDLELYRKIPFILEKNRCDFYTIFPTLSNPSLYLDPEERPLYHALCVMSGNFTTILWQAVLQRFCQMGIDEKHLHPYLTQVMNNLTIDAKQALTGPLSRDDQETIKINLQALRKDPLQDLYNAFLSFYQRNKNECS